MEGARGATLPPELAEHDRTYRIVKLTGWSIETIDATPAVTLDWLLAVDGVHRQVAKDEAERRAKEAARK